MTDQSDVKGRTPEEFVREFLVAYRQWELEATRVDAEAERAWKADPDGGDQVAEAAERTISASYRTLLERYATAKVLAQEVGASWQSPPMADVSATTFVGVEQAMGGVVVRTLEAGHHALPRMECEYRLRLVDGAWRLDDRREGDRHGGWIRRVF